MSALLLNLYAQPIARVCPTPELEERFRIVVQRFHTELEPAIQGEFDLCNDIARAYWLMNYWKRLTNQSRGQLKALKKTEPESPRLAELEKEREHNQWHWIKQQLLMNRLKKRYEEVRAEYAAELAAAGYTIDEAREAFLQSLVAADPAYTEQVLPEAA
jgi:hypothetical protein